MDQGLKNLYRSGATTCAVISNNRSTGIFDYMQSHNAVKIKRKRNIFGFVFFLSLSCTGVTVFGVKGGLTVGTGTSWVPVPAKSILSKLQYTVCIVCLPVSCYMWWPINSVPLVSQVGDPLPAAVPGSEWGSRPTLPLQDQSLAQQISSQGGAQAPRHRQYGTLIHR